VNSPYAADAARAWRAAAVPAELGWHPCLTLDPPCAPPAQVPSLVGPDGRLWPLGPFLARLRTGRVGVSDIEAELGVQFDRFVAPVGGPPALATPPQPVALFPPVGAVLERLLARRCPSPPYVRRVREPWAVLARVPGARFKRVFLNALGRVQGR